MRKPSLPSFAALAGLFLVAASPSFAQERAAALPPEAPANLRAQAAGYKALTVCSAIGDQRTRGGDRSIASVEANELRGIYPELDPLIGAMVAEVSPADWATNPGQPIASVSVAWDAAMPPRLAVSDFVRGCTLRPVGSTREAASPEIILWHPRRAPWPNGDEDALRRPMGDARALAAALTRARDGRSYGEGSNTTAVVVVQRGHIVAEDYASGFGIRTPQRTWSVAKSITATIVGAAVLRGEVDVAAPAAIANWQREGDPRRAITLDHLLHMASGLTSDSAGNRTDAIYFGSTTVDEQAPAWPLVAAPGSTFRYANNDTLLAALAIAPTFAAHPPSSFFDSIAMRSTIAETDWRGNYVLSSQVWATARDLARFGMLYLNDGDWDGTRILPEGWRTYVSTPSGPQPPGNFGYGASFWLMNRNEGVPADTIAAFGNRGQYVVIVPSRDIVIVRRGEDPSAARFDIAAFTRDVLAALD